MKIQASKRTKGRSGGLFGEVGVSGLRVTHGYIYDETLPELKGQLGVRVYRDMSDNDSTVAAMVNAIELLMRSAQWKVLESSREGATDSGKKKEMKELVEGMLFEDLDRSWDNLIADILSMLAYGWSYFEVIYKKRLGMNVPGHHQSQFDDGYIAPKDIKIRAQDSLDRWELSENQDILGMWQLPPEGGHGICFIPYAKALLFRPKLFKDSPEGRSILRSCYRPWYICKHVQDTEAIGIERNLNGLPVIKVPAELLVAASGENPDPIAVATLQKYVEMGRDVKMNEQGCAIIPSDTFTNPDGTYSNVAKVDFTLLASTGTRDIDTNKVITRYQQDMMRTILADFLMLGLQSGSSGSFALHEDKSTLFMKALEGWGSTIADVFNRDLLPKIWRLNNLDYNYIPKVAIGRILEIDLDKLGAFIKDLSGAGAPLFPDEGLENNLREKANLPERSEEADSLSGDFDILQEMAGIQQNPLAPSNRLRGRRTFNTDNSNGQENAVENELVLA